MDEAHFAFLENYKESDKEFEQYFWKSSQNSQNSSKRSSMEFMKKLLEYMNKYEYIKIYKNILKKFQKDVLS